MRVYTVPALTTIGLLLSLGAMTGCGGDSSPSTSATQPPERSTASAPTATEPALAVATSADEDRWGSRWCDIRIGSTRTVVRQRMGKPTTSEPATEGGTAYDLWKTSSSRLNYYANYDEKGKIVELSYRGSSTLECIPNRDEDDPDADYKDGLF